MRYQSRADRFRRVAAAMAGGLVLALLATAAQAAPSLPARPPSAQSSPSPLARLAAGVRSVLLANGDRLVLRPGGVTSTLLPAPGSGPVIALGNGAATADLPFYALPYLGHGLAPAMFSPASLSRAESGGQLRVQIAFSGRLPRLPGVTITQSAGGTAHGYLTASSARVFGAALARQFRADHGRADYGTDGMFASGVTIAPAGSARLPARRAPARKAQPAFAMHELTVTGTDEAGRPDTGDLVIVVNAANWHAFGDHIENNNTFYHGVAKYSVPAGTYWAIAFFAGRGKSARTLRMDVLPQFTVRGRNTRVHLSARAATSELGAATPRPSVLWDFAFEVTREGLHHTAASIGLFGFGDDRLWVNRTTRRPTVGSLTADMTMTLSSPAHAVGVPYAYNLVLSGPAGLLPSEHWNISANRVATVTERFYQEVAGRGQVYWASVFPKMDIGASNPLPVPMPGDEISYLMARPDVAYGAASYHFHDFAAGGDSESWFTVRPGQRLTEDWNAGPLHPQPEVQLLSGSLGRLAPSIPTAIRAGNKLQLIPAPFSDNVPGHAGGGFFNYPGSGVQLSGSYAVYQNGVLLAHGDPVAAENSGLGLPPVTLSPKRAAIRFVLTATRRSSRFPLSPSSRTVWTWHSEPRAGAEVPPTWMCGLGGRRCAVQPLLTLNYHVDGLRPDESTAPGRQVIGLSVGHLQLSDQTRITKATMQVSFDGGNTWHLAAVIPAGSGQFTASFTAPAGSVVTLRTSAADAAGGTITETIQDGYRA